jgi:hypothetical protein
MKDITNPKLLWLKAWLFLCLGIIAITLLLLESPQLKVAFLLALGIWSFCRFYYFAFYVIEHYADPTYRFSGLGAFFRYALRKKGGATASRFCSE